MLSQLWLCMTAAYVALLPKFYLAYHAQNRYLMLWSHKEYFGILLAIGILGTCYLVFFRAAKAGSSRHPVLRRLLRLASSWALYFILIRSLVSLAYAGETLSPSLLRLIDHSAMKAVYYGVFPLPFLILFAGGFAQTIKKIYGALSILFALFLIIPWTYTSFAYSQKSILSMAAKNENRLLPDNSLYVFLFDEWSYARTFGNPSWLNETDFPALSGFLRQSTLYRNAFSPGAYTFSSLSRFFFQMDPKIHATPYHEISRAIHDNRFPADSLPSFYDFSDSHFKSAIGFVVHYPGMLGRHADYYGTFWLANESIGEKARFLLNTQLSFLRVVGISVRISPALSNRFIEFQRHCRPVLQETLRSLPRRNIAFFQFPFPHGPFAFHTNGTLKSEIKFGGQESLDEYLENTGHIEVLLSDILSILKDRGDFDSSLIVVTADHTWAGDRPDFKWVETEKDGVRREIAENEIDDLNPRSPSRHVPLIVKFPGQTEGREVVDPVDIGQMHPLFSAYLSGKSPLGFPMPPAP